MRKTKLVISSLIALVGIFIYFISVPSVDEEALIHLTVESGNKELLDDIYFNGYLYDYGSFHVNNKKGVTTNENLPYLEKIDASEDQTLNNLLEKYPQFMHEVVYNSQITDYSLLNSDEKLISGYFKISDTNYFVDNSTIYLNALNKETKETVEDTIQRESDPASDSVNIIGMHEEYPVVKILYSTSTWTTDSLGEKSNLSVGEYNFETKTYSEESLLNEEGSFYAYNSDPYNIKNNKVQIIRHDGNEDHPTAYIYNFIEDTLSPFQTTATNSFVGNKDQLYTLENEGEEILLRQYDQTGQKIENEVALENELPLNFYEEEAILLSEVINDQLFIVQSTINERLEQDIPPTKLQVFDLHSGKNLLTGKIEYDTDSKVNATEGYIHSIGQMSDF